MNPLIADVLEAKARQDIEIASLELALAGDCKCESGHNYGQLVCSGDVTYLLSSCTPPKKICSSMGKAAQQWISEGDDSICGECDLALYKCWTIRPI